MIDMVKCREKFEELTAPSFSFYDKEVTLGCDRQGCYIHLPLEDHWNTFQEGWEAAIDSLKES